MRELCNHRSGKFFLARLFYLISIICWHLICPWLQEESEKLLRLVTWQDYVSEVSKIKKCPSKTLIWTSCCHFVLCKHQELVTLWKQWPRLNTQYPPPLWLKVFWGISSRCEFINKHGSFYLRNSLFYHQNKHEAIALNFWWHFYLFLWCPMSPNTNKYTKYFPTFIKIN